MIVFNPHFFSSYTTPETNQASSIIGTIALLLPTGIMGLGSRIDRAQLKGIDFLKAYIVTYLFTLNVFSSLLSVQLFLPCEVPRQQNERDVKVVFRLQPSVLWAPCDPCQLTL